MPEFYGSTDADGEYIFIVDLEEYGLFRGHCVCVTLEWSHVTDDSFKLPQQQELWYSYFLCLTAHLTYPNRPIEVL
jgi:hypothetical protein